jgi:hypothetical protein
MDRPNPQNKRSRDKLQRSPWTGGPDRERAVEAERLRALLDEAWRIDPRRGALATRAISVLDLEEIFAAGRFDLLVILSDWTDKLPASCRACGTRLNAPDDIGGFSITTAAHAPKPRFAVVSGFCHECAVRGHEAMLASAVSALRSEGLVAEVLGMEADRT